MAEVRLPDLGETGEVTIVEWFKSEGDAVRVGEELLEVETEKTTFVIEAQQTGRVTRILKPQGDTAHFDDVLARVD
jgi:pyruvate/2-oxoglutarate dehydrogenase complex dihydrolipoamide acyltransferase (E2) component